MGKNLLLRKTQKVEEIVAVDGEYKIITPRTWVSVEVIPPEPEPELPLLYIRSKGRSHTINFCPKASEENIDPVYIPIEIKEDGDSQRSDSTLEFEFYAPKPGVEPLGETQIPVVEGKNALVNSLNQIEDSTNEPTPPSSSDKTVKKNKVSKNKSSSSHGKKVKWEEESTYIEKIS